MKKIISVLLLCVMLLSTLVAMPVTVNADFATIIDDIDFSVGVLYGDFDSSNSESVIFVSQNTTEITITPKFTSGYINVNGDIIRGGDNLTVDLVNRTTPIDIKRVGATGEQLYTCLFNVAKTSNLLVTGNISQDKKEVNVSCCLDDNYCVFLALYRENRLVELQKQAFEGKNIKFALSNKIYDTAKVFVWESMSSFKPVDLKEYRAEISTAIITNFDTIVVEDSTNVISYWKDLDDRKMTEFDVADITADGVTVYYNGKAMDADDVDTEGELQAILRGASSITLAYNKTLSSVYTSIFVTDYAYAQVKSVNAAESIIKLKLGYLDLSEETRDEDFIYNIYDAEGNAIGLEDIKEGDILNILTAYGVSYADSACDYVDIYVSNETVTGKVTENKDGKWIIDGKGYTAVAGDTVLYGDEGIFFLTIDGKIFDCDETALISKDFAFLTGIDENDSTFETSYVLHAYTKNGHEKFNVASKVKLIYANIVSTNYHTDNTQTNRQSDIFASGGLFFDAIVNTYVDEDEATAIAGIKDNYATRFFSYKLNEAGEIIEIRLPGTVGAVGSKLIRTETDSANWNADFEEFEGEAVVDVPLFVAPIAVTGSGPYTATLYRKDIRIAEFSSLKEDQNYLANIYTFEDKDELVAVLLAEETGTPIPEEPTPIEPEDPTVSKDFAFLTGIDEDESTFETTYVLHAYTKNGHEKFDVASKVKVIDFTNTATNYYTDNAEANTQSDIFASGGFFYDAIVNVATEATAAEAIAAIRYEYAVRFFSYKLNDAGEIIEIRLAGAADPAKLIRTETDSASWDADFEEFEGEAVVDVPLFVAPIAVAGYGPYYTATLDRHDIRIAEFSSLKEDQNYMANIYTLEDEDAPVAVLLAEETGTPIPEEPTPIEPEDPTVSKDFAFLTGIDEDESTFETTYVLHAYTKNGHEKFDVASKVKVIDFTNAATNFYTDNTETNTQSDIFAYGGMFYDAIVNTATEATEADAIAAIRDEYAVRFFSYKLNEAGEIIEIRLAGAADPAKLIRTETDSASWDADFEEFEGEPVVDVPLFVAPITVTGYGPYTATLDRNEITIANFSSLKDGEDYMANIYTLEDEDELVAVLLAEETGFSFDDSHIAVVQNIGTALDDEDNAVRSITFVQSGATGTLKVSADIKFANDVADLANGDIFFYAVDADNEIVKLEKIYDAGTRTLPVADTYDIDDDDFAFVYGIVMAAGDKITLASQVDDATGVLKAADGYSIKLAVNEVEGATYAWVEEASMARKGCKQISITGVKETIRPSQVYTAVAVVNANKKVEDIVVIAVNADYADDDAINTALSAKFELNYED